MRVLCSSFLGMVDGSFQVPSVIQPRGFSSQVRLGFCSLHRLGLTFQELVPPNSCRRQTFKYFSRWRTHHVMFVVQPTLPQWQWGRPSPPRHLTRRKLVIRGMIPSRHWGESIEREVIWIPGTSLSSIFGLQPPKTRPFPTRKTLDHLGSRYGYGKDPVQLQTCQGSQCF